MYFQIFDTYLKVEILSFIFMLKLENTFCIVDVVYRISSYNKMLCPASIMR